MERIELTRTHSQKASLSNPSLNSNSATSKACFCPIRRVQALVPMSALDPELAEDRVMKLKNFLVILGVSLLAIFPSQAQFRVGGVITAANAPKGTVFLTFDDGLDETGPDGQTQIEKVGRYLHGPVNFSSPMGPVNPIGSSTDVKKSIRATFALVTCHFVGQDLADPNSSLCNGYGDQPKNIATGLIQLGHDLINHSVNHIPLTTIQDPSKIIYEVGRAQKELDQLQDNSPRLFRGPGLAFNSGVANVLNADPYTGKLIGPIDADVGADFYTGTWMGGDWDCIARGMSVKACGDLYVNAISSATHGVIVLLHVRTEMMSGRNGSAFPINLIKYIVKHLGPGYDYLPLDAIPGVLGTTATTPTRRVTTEFSPGDGEGTVVAGPIAGKGQPSGLCKARHGTIYCMLSDGKGGVLPATPWLRIGDQTWFSTYNSKFWLADINGDGLTDVVFPGSSGLWVASNTGRSTFNAPVMFYAGAVPDTRFIRFGKVNAGRLEDMVVWTPDLTMPRLYRNGGMRFLAPAAVTATRATPPPEEQLLTFQLLDLNGDGREDVVIKKSTRVWCTLSTGSGFGPLKPCSTVGGQFADSQGWSEPGYASTFATAHSTAQRS